MVRDTTVMAAVVDAMDSAALLGMAATSVAGGVEVARARGSVVVALAREGQKAMAVVLVQTPTDQGALRSQQCAGSLVPAA